MKKIIFENKYIQYILIFTIFFVFFAYIHPLIPFDTDDWLYNGTYRPPFPKLGLWNPTKVLPEFLEPTIAFGAAYLIYPLLGDYFLSLTIANAFFVALLVTIYFYSIHLVIKQNFNISEICAVCCTILLIILHFSVLCIYPTNNDHLFFSRDVTCYYHYTISNLFCAILVLWLIRNDIHKINNSLIWGLLILFTYLALCSNLYSSVILVAFVGAKLIINLVNNTKRFSISAFIKSNIYYLSIILFWLIIQMIEVNGERANSYGYLQASFLTSLKDTIIRFVGIQYNHRFIQISFSLILCAGFISIFSGYNWKKIFNSYAKIVIALLLSIIYLVLLSSKVKPEYIQKGDVVFSFLFFYLIIIAYCLGYICSKCKYIKLIIPILVLILFFDIQKSNNVYKDIQYWNGTNIYDIKRINSYVLNTIQEADKKGLESLTIKVPWYNDYINWPFDYQHSLFVGKTLYKHNQIHHPIKTYFEIVKEDYSE